VLRRCVFVGNSALNSGGAIYSSIATSNLLFDSCRWEHNKCSLFGGAIYLGDSHFGVVMRNSVMNFNSADSGMVETLLVTWLFIGWG
jgi:predicted outer membrane repeat protein